MKELHIKLKKNEETLDNVNKDIGKMMETLGSVDDDAQLANIDLQNMLQKQQQVIQMLSNISKVLNDSALVIIRKIG